MGVVMGWDTQVTRDLGLRKYAVHRVSQGYAL